MEENEKDLQRKNMMQFDATIFSRLVLNDLSSNKNGRAVLKKYKQSEIIDIIENYTLEKNQIKLREISRLLFAKSPQYRRLVRHFSDMALFSYVIEPCRNLEKLNVSKVTKQYEDISELAKVMSLRHEMQKVLRTIFIEDAFFGYVHKDKNSFYIQKIDPSIVKITHVDDSIYNFSIDMTHFYDDESKLESWGVEVKVKYRAWKSARDKNPKIDGFVELDAKNTICIKANEEFSHLFPPFAGSFDSIFDIDGFKKLRKDKEELGNYAIVTQELPMRKDSENNNDFLIDNKYMKFFHNSAVDSVPDNVGVITSPMKIEALKFDKDRVDNDGVGKATRDFWEGSGTSNLLFSSSANSAVGLASSIKSDEQIVFGVLAQINRWLNRYLKHQFKDLYFHINVLPVTEYNRKEMFDMYIQAGSYGYPVKSHIGAVAGLEPIVTTNMIYLENEILKLHEKFIPLMNSHVMSGDMMNADSKEAGSPKKDDNEIADETVRTRDKA